MGQNWAKTHDKKVKVLFILDFLSYGGIERLAYDFLINSYSNPNFEFILLNLDGGSFEKEFNKLPLRHFRFFRKRFIDINVILRLRKLIKKENIDIVHSQNIVGDFYAYLAGIGGNVKLIRTFHSLGKKKKWNKIITHILLGKHSLNIAVSNSFRDQIIHYFKPKVSENFRMVYNGIDFNRLITKKTSIRKQTGIPENALLFGMVGNFVNIKDQLTICKSMKILRDRENNAHFVFVGTHNGIDKYYLQNCIDYCTKHQLSDRVHFLGLRTNAPDIVAELDLFVFSSLYDTFGIAMAEAMALGIPCISSNIEPLREITNNGMYARLFETGNEYKLADEIVSFIKDPGNFSKMAELAKTHVHTMFSIENHTQSNFALYNEVLLMNKATKRKS